DVDVAQRLKGQVFLDEKLLDDALFLDVAVLQHVDLVGGGDRADLAHLGVQQAVDEGALARLHFAYHHQQEQLFQVAAQAGDLVDHLVVEILLDQQVAQGLQQLALFGHALGDFLVRSEEHTSELQSREKLVCRLLLEKKNIV